MRTETLLGTYIPQMLAANIQYKKYTTKMYIMAHRNPLSDVYS